VTRAAGDGAGPAAAAAAAVGIPLADTHWGLLPEDKLQLVRASALPPRDYINTLPPASEDKLQMVRASASPL